MSLMRFANVVLERNPRAMSCPALYCRSDRPVIFDDERREWLLYGAGTFDFSTYFNALSVSKLKRYASVGRFVLHLELKGAACTLWQTKGDAFSDRPARVASSCREVAASDAWQSLDFELSVDDETVLAGFVLETAGTVALGDCHYAVEPVRPLRDVELCLVTTTFKKETFVEANIAAIEADILSGDDDIARHVSLRVIDNGRTLDVSRLQRDRISISPNDNVGGSGGFARGMVEALEQQPRATHVLLMDDDVAMSPESIRRTYNLLRIVDDEYADAFVSGAMLNMEVPDQQWEDTGLIDESGLLAPAKPPLRLTNFEDLVYNELFRIPEEVARTRRRYAAWWYCCIPVSAIEEHGLPLPVFVRFDDVEFGVRCAPTFMTMNGICVWHMPFNARYNAAVERYQTTRNTMIALCSAGVSPTVGFMDELHNNIRLELKKFGYENAELCLDGFEDFMKGPAYLAQPGVAEKTFMRANRAKERLVPFDELERQAHALGLTDFHIMQADRQLIDSDKARSFVERLSDYATDNHQRLLVKKGRGYALIPIEGWAYPAGVIRGKKHLIVIDWHNRCGTIRTKDPARYARIVKRYKEDLAYFKRHRKEVCRAYAERRDELTSVTFWESYLGMA